MLVVIGNGRSYGGGMTVLPDASLVDGMLDLCIVQALSKSAFLRAFPKVFMGRHTTHPKVRMLRASSRHGRSGVETCRSMPMGSGWGRSLHRSR